MSNGGGRGVGQYVGLPPLESVEQIAAWLGQQGLAVDSLGSNFCGQPLLRVTKGGGLGRPIVITAGAHAGEPSGVLAALLLAKEHQFQAPTYIVPLRDPFAWQPYALVLANAAGGSAVPPITDHASAVRALQALGTLLPPQQGNLVIALVNGVAFASMPPSDPPVGPRQLEQAVNQALAADADLVRALLGKRIVFPSIAGPVAEGVGDYGRSFSATIRGHGVVADMNRGFGGSEEPAEVALLRQMVDELRPGLVIDLHEGQGTTFYAFVGAASPHPETQAYASLALDAMAFDGARPVSLADLERSFGPRIRQELSEPVPGLMVGRVQNTALEGTSFGNYCDRYCPSITTETGRWAPLELRVRRQLAAAKAIIAAYERA